MHAEILSIGNEITSGLVLDTNSQWLSLRLEELGVHVLYRSTVGDELDPLADVFRHAIARADIVISTGGLGPTADDLTRESLAKAVGRKLLPNEEALTHIRGIFARRKRELAQRNEKQAMFPEGSRMVHNPNGTAPGIDLEVPRQGTTPCRVVCLPGVPAEMKEMWYDSVGELLRKGGAGRTMVRHRRINCFGAGESQIEALLPGLINATQNPHVDITASQTTIILWITAEGPTEEACYATMEPTIALIRNRLGNLVYGQDDEELQDAVVRLLRQHRKTLATAEWGTTGLVAQWLDSVHEGDGFYLGGVVAPGEKVLKDLLGVPAEVLAKHPATSGEVAQSMAARCRERFGSDYGLAVARFPQYDPAAPTPKSVFFALATPEGVKLKEIPFAAHPAMLKVYCAKQALNMVRLALLEKA